MFRNRAVIVDDEAGIRELLSRIVKHESLRPDSYADSRTAFAALQECPDDVVLVIIEVRMPGLSGLEFMRRASADFPGIPFIITSNRGSKKEIVQALKQGVFDYFEKPFPVKEISAAIRKAGLQADVAFKAIQAYRNLVEKKLIFVLGNDVVQVPPLVGSLIEEVKLSCRIPPSQLPGMRMGLHELLVNAIEHGNLELDSELKSRQDYFEVLKKRAAEPRFRTRRVTVEVLITADSFSCTIKDQGPGFDWRELPNPGAPENLFKPHGRGVVMGIKFFDEFSYNKSGNQVTVRKFFKE